MALKVHLLKSYNPSHNVGETECGEPLHRHPQILGRGLVVEGEFESGRRIGGLIAVGEFEFGLAVSNRHGNACAKCRRVWMMDAA